MQKTLTRFRRRRTLRLAVERREQEYREECLQARSR
jgi:hypothetical protein